MIDIKDAYIANIAGGAIFKKDFLFNINIEKIANDIQIVLEKKKYSLLSVDIDKKEKTIEIRELVDYKENKRVIFSIDEEYISILTGKIKINEILNSKKNCLSKIELFDELTEMFKSNFSKEMIGIKPTMVIPFTEENVNTRILKNCLNKKYFSNQSFFNFNSTKKFEINFTTEIKEDIFLEINLRKNSKHIQIDNDFRLTRKNSKSFKEYILETLNQDYFLWVSEFIIELTNNYNKVDLPFLTKGVSDSDE